MLPSLRTLRSLVLPALILAAVIILAQSTARAQGWDAGGSAGGETRIFLDDPAWPGQADDVQSSIILEGDFRWRSEDRRHQLVVVPWARIDSTDDERTHADLREGFYRYIGDTFTLETGLIKVFWGVTESRHLVDIINQTDLVEDSDDYPQGLSHPSSGATPRSLPIGSLFSAVRIEAA